MKKILALILALVMVVGMLAACGDEGVPYVPGGSTGATNSTDPSDPTDPTDPPIVFNEEVLVGVWDLTMQPMTADYFGEAVEQYAFLEGLTLDTQVQSVYEFRDDGTMVFKTHKDELQKVFDSMIPAIEKHLKDGAVYKLYEQQGMSQDDLDAMLEAAGMTTDDLVDAIMVELEPVFSSYSDALIESVVTDAEGYIVSYGTYTLDGDVLTIDDEETVYEVTCDYDGDKTVVFTGTEEGNALDGAVMVKRDA